MKSIKELYKTGSGPSSSHTIAPQRALKLYKKSFPQADHFLVTLYGSLSLTGKGHYSDEALIKAAKPASCEVKFALDWSYDFPNGLTIKGYASNQPLDTWVVYSLGGGSIKILGQDFDFQKQVYPEQSFNEIHEFCTNNQLTLAEYVYFYEPEAKSYLKGILQQMFTTIDSGLANEGYLLGRLKMPRIAKKLYLDTLTNDALSDDEIKRQRLIAYAYATMEENATLGTVVTAPTCGSAGVLAAVMYYYHHDLKYDKDKLVDALATGGIFGNLVKTNATISGAEGGCQAEVGVACAMASAAIASLMSDSIEEIEYAAEIGMEHHLGLTCDPVGGYVIIPCIERNGAAALRSIDSAFMAKQLIRMKPNRVRFDDVVETMKYTGQKIAVELRETSLGGLATQIKVE